MYGSYALSKGQKMLKYIAYILYPVRSFVRMTSLYYEHRPLGIIITERVTKMETRKSSEFEKLDRLLVLQGDTLQRVEELESKNASTDKKINGKCRCCRCYIRTGL